MSNVALDISGYQNPTLSLILWVVAGAFLLVAAIYWINVRIRGGGKAQGLGGSRMVDHLSDEESGRCIDNRSQSMSNSPGGQQAFGDIINQGPQPRDISQSAGKALVRELQKYDPERFQISWMMDAESGELGTVLQELLEQSGWQVTMQVPGAMLSGGPPRGVIVETSVNSEAVNTLVSWLEQVNLNPQLNREEHRFGILTRSFDDSPPPPVHIVVGVLPR